MLAKLDIGKHVLVPKHEILPKKEAQKVLEHYMLSPYQLPLIKSSDPAAKAIGAKPGDILKITRDSLAAGMAIYYRYVIRSERG